MLILGNSNDEINLNYKIDENAQIQFLNNCPTNIRKQVKSNSRYFTTIPGGWVVGRVHSFDKLKIRLTKFNCQLANTHSWLSKINLFLPQLSHTYSKI